jgi:hypothetical protein
MSQKNIIYHTLSLYTEYGTGFEVLTAVAMKNST